MHEFAPKKAARRGGNGGSYGRATANNYPDTLKKPHENQADCSGGMRRKVRCEPECEQCKQL